MNFFVPFHCMFSIVLIFMSTFDLTYSVSTARWMFNSLIFNTFSLSLSHVCMCMCVYNISSICGFSCILQSFLCANIGIDIFSLRYLYIFNDFYLIFLLFIEKRYLKISHYDWWLVFFSFFRHVLPHIFLQLIFIISWSIKKFYLKVCLVLILV